jgi:hypothetical protein
MDKRRRYAHLLTHLNSNFVETALIAGLEAVQGPNWAAILQLYGPGGSISEALKDRSQVQLKDKARNLKLWFLKHGEGVPPILEQVTGHLKGERSSATTETPPKPKVKKRRLEETASGRTSNVSARGGSRGQSTAYPEGSWSSTAHTQEDVDMAEHNVDPGLQMPHRR